MYSLDYLGQENAANIQYDLIFLGKYLLYLYWGLMSCANDVYM